MYIALKGAIFTKKLNVHLHKGKVLLAVDFRHELPVEGPPPDEAIPPVRSIHGAGRRGHLFDRSLDALGVAREILRLHRGLLDLLDLVDGHVAGAERLVGIVPADDVLELLGLGVEEGKLPLPQALVAELFASPDVLDLVDGVEPLLLV